MQQLARLEVVLLFSCGKIEEHSKTSLPVGDRVTSYQM